MQEQIRRIECMSRQHSLHWPIYPVSTTEDNLEGRKLCCCIEMHEICACWMVYCVLLVKLYEEGRLTMLLSGNSEAGTQY